MRRRLKQGAAACVVFVVPFLFGAAAPTAEAVTGTTKVQIVLENPDYATVAVDSQGTSYGVNASSAAPGGKYRLFTSHDEGRTWAQAYDFPAYTRIYSLSVLSSGTLLLHLVNTDWYLYRSDDGGHSWTQVLHMPLLYETLTSHSVTDDGTYAYVGSYNVLDSTSHDNWIWRSADDGRTWSIVRTTTTHRHIHAVQVDRSTGTLYALYGDSNSQAAIERSTDHGVTWQTVCVGTPCVAVDIAFDGSGHAVFGQDQPLGGGHIQKLTLANGTISSSALVMPGPSYSTLFLNGTYLIGTSREPNGAYPADDPNLHLYGSEDGGSTFSEYFAIPWQNASAYVDLIVQYTFPNGDFPIQVEGYGTIIARLADHDGGDTTAPVISSVGVVPSLSGGVVSWGTDEAASSQVEFGLTSSYGSSTAVDAALVTGHSVTLGSLASGTLYHYRVKSRDAAGNLAVGVDRTFTTTADTTAPVISSVGVVPSLSGGVVSWGTDEAASSQVEFGLTSSYGSSSTVDVALVTGHSVTLGLLASGTLYHYRVKSRDAAGNLAVGVDRTFTTTADTTAPVISSVGVVPSLSGGVVSWGTDEAASSQVEFGLTSSYGSSSTVDVALVTGHSVTLGSLASGTLYHYRVKSRDAAGNLAVGVDRTFTTTADTTAPVISSVGVVPSLSGGVVSWGTDEAASSQVEFGLTSSYGSSSTVDVALVTGHSVTLGSLASGTLYHYRVKSRDAAGNLAVGVDRTFTTTADTTAPVISSVGVVPSLSGGVVSWGTDEAASSQVEFGLTSSYGSSSTVDVALVTGHSVTLGLLASGTLYHYRVKSRDAAGNLAVGVDRTFTTTADGGGDGTVAMPELPVVGSLPVVSSPPVLTGVLGISAFVVTPSYRGTVGPGFTIKMASKPTKARKVKIVVADRSAIHNFHLIGPGVSVKTSVKGIGVKTFTVTLKKGIYKFICDPHPFMKGSFKIK